MLDVKRKTDGSTKKKDDTPAGPELSVVKTLGEQLEQLVSDVKNLKQKLNETSHTNFEFNTTYRGRSKGIPIEETIPTDDLIVLDGSLDGKGVGVLKDDGCNTNVVSQEFSERNCKDFDWKNCKVEVSHSQKESVENSSKAILEATLTIGKHSCKSKWFLANCQYDVLLGMPWHIAYNPSINYEKRIVQVGENALATDCSDESEANILKLSVKKFRNMMKEKR